MTLALTAPSSPSPDELLKLTQARKQPFTENKEQS
jgi:hypothetical protein